MFVVKQEAFFVVASRWSMYTRMWLKLVEFTSVLLDIHSAKPLNKDHTPQQKKTHFRGQVLYSKLYTSKVKINEPLTKSYGYAYFSAHLFTSRRLVILLSKTHSKYTYTAVSVHLQNLPIISNSRVRWFKADQHRTNCHVGTTVEDYRHITAVSKQLRETKQNTTFSLKQNTTINIEKQRKTQHNLKKQSKTQQSILRNKAKHNNKCGNNI